MRKSQLSLIHFVMAILAVWGGAGASGLFDWPVKAVRRRRRVAVRYRVTVPEQIVVHVRMVRISEAARKFKGALLVHGEAQLSVQ